VDGIFVEPASAASIAGLIKYNRESRFPAGCRVVCTLTGHGLKDPDTAMGNSSKPIPVVARKAAVLEALGL
jgi:threonine synthase